MQLQEHRLRPGEILSSGSSLSDSSSRTYTPAHTNSLFFSVFVWSTLFCSNEKEACTCRICPALTLSLQYEISVLPVFLSRVVMEEMRQISSGLKELYSRVETTNEHKAALEQEAWHREEQLRCNSSTHTCTHKSKSKSSNRRSYLTACGLTQFLSTF